MSLIWMKDFSAGLDVRRSPAAAGQGVLSRAHDVHITSGGDIEQRADFNQAYAGHPAVLGYISDNGAVLCVTRDKDDSPDFDWDGVRPLGLPGRFRVARVPRIAGTGDEPVRVIDSTRRGGRAFFTVLYASGATRLYGAPETNNGKVERPVYHYFDPDPDAPASVATKYMRHPIKNTGMMTEMEAFRILTSAGQTGTAWITRFLALPRFALVKGVYAKFRHISGVRVVNGEPEYILAGGTFDVSTVNRTSSGAIRKYALIDGEFFEDQSVPNADAWVFVSEGYVRYEFANDYPAGASDEDINNAETRSYAPSRVHAISRKLVVSNGQTTMFSGLTDPMWFFPDIVESDTPNPGSGFIDMTSETDGSGPITAYATYGDRLAVFFENETQIWTVDVDLANSKLAQTVPGGTTEGASVIATAQDVFYADRSGVRSLRSRDSSGTLTVDDAGSPINDLIRGRTGIVAAKDPESGRILFCSGSEAFVLSTYPGQRTAAWTVYGLPLEVAGAAEGWGRLHLYGQDGRIFAYGSLTDATPYAYGDSSPEVFTPLLSAEDPASVKVSRGIDAVVDGSWRISVSTTHHDPLVEDVVAEIESDTYDEGRIPMTGTWTHLQLRFRCTAPESATKPARLASAQVHFDGRDPSD